MDKIILEFPSKERELDAIEYIKEFLHYNSNFNGVGGLNKDYLDYDNWLIKIHNSLNKDKVGDGKVPATTFFAIRKSDNKIVGMINIRHYLNEQLKLFGGHIGYSVRPTQRKKGYATQILSLGLIKAKELDIDKALVTCDKINIGSAKAIQNNGGILEDEIVENDGNIVRRYWIEIDKVLSKNQIDK